MHFWDFKNPSHLLKPEISLNSLLVLVIYLSLFTNLTHTCSTQLNLLGKLVRVKHFSLSPISDVEKSFTTLTPDRKVLIEKKLANSVHFGRFRIQMSFEFAETHPSRNPVVERVGPILSRYSDPNLLRFLFVRRPRILFRWRSNSCRFLRRLLRRFRRRIYVGVLQRRFFKIGRRICERVWKYILKNRL
jgi:hypothetical protein